MSTAILSALPEEQAGLVHALQHPQRITRAGRSFWRGELHGRSVVLALSGIGKVAAATTATALIEHFGVARIVFTGVAGGLGDAVRVGDVVVAQTYLQHDMDASPLFPRWELPGYARSLLECDANLSALLLIAARDCVSSDSGQSGSSSVPRSAHKGLIASGDRFVSSAHESLSLRDALRAAGHEVLAVEMEGAAVAQVCRDYDIPFAAARTISDRADDTAHVDFPQFIQTVASRYAEHIVGKLLQSL
ncbi:5'-methylthioadenosine/adenosylhomocysteine nucleosidase [Acidovorax sp. sic0104]|uniref:5'-methylthioadenosine/adenosylhomocysteine nucleosidase n=1 Tax=Acidovorax sp. sic0104 TaxID=2854784 RepID=UPI001C451285|nr:5'-methylthioadenosine/adenosylhomocysteine nucleosidase [Acidovorax sp. sic0104]MBV7541399.1 5'-methylthioadenosine/adenosylhomocysteine nucleosidase [Acidovorax sp. sic0104]